MHGLVLSLWQMTFYSVYTPLTVCTIVTDRRQTDRPHYTDIITIASIADTVITVA